MDRRSSVLLDREFAPDERQPRLLKEAALVGEAIPKANTFSKSFEGINLYKGAHWDRSRIVNSDDRAEHVGQLYRTGHKEGSGEFLSGSLHYSFVAPEPRGRAPRVPLPLHEKA